MSLPIENKKARFNYEILEKFEAGLELSGHEVKSLRKGYGSLDGAHITVRGGEAYVIGMRIPPFQPNNVPAGYEEERIKKLILTKPEIATLGTAEAKKGLTIVPISVYNSRRKLKITIAVVRGKREFDKRETIKKREADREMRRSLKTE